MFSIAANPAWSRQQGYLKGRGPVAISNSHIDSKLLNFKSFLAIHDLLTLSPAYVLR